MPVSPSSRRRPLEYLEARTQLGGSEWALGIEARSSWAIISDGDAAEKHYRDAIHRLGRCGAAADEARGHLLHGECLRLQRRRVDARGMFRPAEEMFAAMGALAFAARARTSCSGPARAPEWSRRSSCRPDAAGAPGRRARPGGHRTRRSAPACSSAPAPSSTTCARCSPSLASSPDGSSLYVAQPDSTAGCVRGRAWPARGLFSSFGVARSARPSTVTASLAAYTRSSVVRAGRRRVVRERLPGASRGGEHGRQQVARRDVELGEHVGQVVFDRSAADRRLRCDLGVSRGLEPPAWRSASPGV